MSSHRNGPRDLRLQERYILRHHSSLGHRAGCKVAREPEDGLSKHALKQAFDFIGDNLGGNFSLAEMASATGLSSRHFSRLFKEPTGFSPYQYVIHKRVEKAKTLLANTDLPVGEIALACGFSHQAHLTRQFGRLAGTSPKKLRR